MWLDLILLLRFEVLMFPCGYVCGMFGLHVWLHVPLLNSMEIFESWLTKQYLTLLKCKKIPKAFTCKIMGVFGAGSSR